MEVFKYHVFICTQAKPEKTPACPASGAEQTLAALREEIAKAGLDKDVLITTSGCLGLCEKGPNLLVYPEGAWYSGVKPEMVREIVEEHFKNGRPVKKYLRTDSAAIRQEITDHFNKVKALKAILDKAGMIPEEVGAVMRGFMESRIVLSAIELDIFTAIGNGASPKQVAKKTNADIRATEAVLNALAGLKLLTKKEEKFYNTPITSRFLVAGAADDSRSAMMHSVHLWKRWSTLTAAVKKGGPVANVDPQERGKDGTFAFIAAMHKNASFRAKQIANTIDLTGVNSILDLGAGSGAYAIAFAQKKPDLKITAFDLPIVIPLTKKYIKEAGLTGKINFLAGNMLTDDLGKHYDLVLLNAICHMFGPEENIMLFKRINSVLNKNGRVVVQDFILNDDKTSPRQAAVFAINMLVNTQSGSTYSAKEYIDWLKSSGFADAKLAPLSGPTDLVIARKS